MEFQSTLPAREATPSFRTFLPVVSIFQSTLPAREATSLFFTVKSFYQDFNPRFPRGKRRG